MGVGYSYNYLVKLDCSPGGIGSFIYPEFAERALDGLLEEENSNQHAKELARQPGEPVSVLTRVYYCQEEDHESCPNADPSHPGKEQIGPNARTILSKAVAVPIYESDGFRNTYYQQRLPTDECLQVSPIWLSVSETCKA